MRIGSAIEKPTVLRGSSDAKGSWKMYWTSRRSLLRSAAPISDRGRPRNEMRPEVASCNCWMVRPIVDLPEPDSPTSASVSPGWMSKETCVTAWT